MSPDLLLSTEELFAAKTRSSSFVFSPPRPKSQHSNDITPHPASLLPPLPIFLQSPLDIFGWRLVVRGKFGSELQLEPEPGRTELKVQF